MELLVYVFSESKDTVGTLGPSTVISYMNPGNVCDTSQLQRRPSQTHRIDSVSFINIDIFPNRSVKSFSARVVIPAWVTGKILKVGLECTRNVKILDDFEILVHMFKVKTIHKGEKSHYSVQILVFSKSFKERSSYSDSIRRTKYSKICPQSFVFSVWNGNMTLLLQRS